MYNRIATNLRNNDAELIDDDFKFHLNFVMIQIQFIIGKGKYN